MWCSSSPGAPPWPRLGVPCLGDVPHLVIAPPRFLCLGAPHKPSVPGALVLLHTKPLACSASVSFSIVLSLSSNPYLSLYLLNFCPLHLLIAASLHPLFHFSSDSFISPSNLPFLLRLFHFSFDSFISPSTLPFLL
jgi:hypothetical protein